MTRTAEDFMAAAPSPKTEANGTSQSPPPTEKRSKFDPVCIPLSSTPLHRARTPPHSRKRVTYYNLVASREFDFLR
jgi:hypothetical protein